MLIGCYYYAWYHGSWLHKTIRQNDPPLLGQYNNVHYGDTILTHFRQIKEAGIDFIAVSWFKDDFGYLLDAANEVGIKITYFYESLRRGKQNHVAKTAYPIILKDIERVVDDMEESCWLRVDGRPVLMFYVTRTFNDTINELIADIRKLIPNVFFVADEYFWRPVSDSRILMYDAVTAYNMYEIGRFDTSSDVLAASSFLNASNAQMQIHSAQCSRLNKPLWGCAMPGYDDSKVRSSRKHPPLPRLNGEFFKQSLYSAKKMSTNNQAMMICSWNEIYEDTQIEPMTSYGNQYLDIVKEFKGSLNG